MTTHKDTPAPYGTDAAWFFAWVQRGSSVSSATGVVADVVPDDGAEQRANRHGGKLAVAATELGADQGAGAGANDRANHLGVAGRGRAVTRRRTIDVDRARSVMNHVVMDDTMPDSRAGPGGPVVETVMDDPVMNHPVVDHMMAGVPAVTPAVRLGRCGREYGAGRNQTGAKRQNA